MPSSQDPSKVAPARDLDELVPRLRPRLLALLRRYRVDDPEDVLQEVWELYLRHGGAIREPECVAGWLRTTAARQALRAANGRREFPSGELALEAVSPVAPVDDELVRTARNRQLWRAVRRLPLRERKLVVLLAHEPQLTYAELALRIGVSPSSIGPIRARSLRRLRRMLTTDVRTL